MDCDGDVVILSGQSNMAGRGGVRDSKWDEVVLEECEAGAGISILRLTAGLEWEAAREPLHWDIDTAKTCGVGPGLMFAAAATTASGAIGLVPCAIGATSIAEWHRQSELYKNMIRRAEAARAGGSHIRALLWYQGESDTLSPDAASRFYERLLALFANVRTDLLIPNLPIIQVGITIASHPHPELLEQVRQAQRAVHIPNVFYVDAQGLPLQEDGVHLTTQGQVRLGAMLAHVYNEQLYP